ncbi:serine kinase [Altererythrobacter sp. B11]|uniref:HPr kinase/phosphorylase n=1 Tax=Altererythrobacter sp. B11 TaxID=2060312 RepID=UPI000DC728AD|nr:HPr kinase/phosphatase C-terminal domain-containing protein [Altererythrobacter sp. B11]BBC73754.1 serine kinase [Altererythrobacter sp. B11]
MSETLHQASCVAIGGRALLIEGPPGSGKSSLALALIDRGAQLVGDDGVRLEQREGRLWALPPPNIAGLIEIRNVGLAQMEPVEAPVALALALDPAAPRFVEQAEQATRGGLAVPLVRLWPESPVLGLRAEYALEIHGLR